MKNFKKLLLIAVAALGFVACGDDDDDKDTTTSATTTVAVSSFTGSVVYNGEQQDNITIKTTCKNNTCTIDLNQITFAPNMPSMDISVKDIAFTVEGTDTVLNATNLTATYTMMGNTAEISTMGMSIPTVTGTINNGGATLTIGLSRQGTTNEIQYRGTRN